MGVAIFEDSSKTLYADFLGHYGKLENNPRADCLEKLHIANIGDLFSTQWQSKKGFYRKSDHFVIYSKHWLFREYIQILDIITPNAHKRIDSLISDLLDKAEQFNAMGKAEIEALPHYTANHILAEHITTTE